MDMINLREAPLVDKPEDGATLFALNVDGSINRIKADGVGGGGKVAVIKADLGMESAVSLQNIRDGVSTLASEPASYSATCENMTFAEACEIVKAGKKLDAIVTATADGLVMTGYAIGVMYESASGGGKAAKAAAGSTSEALGIMTDALEVDAVILWIWTADGITGQLQN